MPAIAIPPFPPVPSPSTWVNGPILVSQLRADVTDGVNFLANRPGFLAQGTTGQSITSGAFTSVTLDSEVYDTWAGHNPTSNSAHYYCQAPGWYLVTAFAPWQYTSSTVVRFATQIQANTSGGSTQYVGQLHQVGSTNRPGVPATDLVQLTRTGAIGGAAVDSVEFQVLQNSGGPLSLVSGSTPFEPRMAVRWVAANRGFVDLPVPANPAWPVPPAYITPDFLNTNIRDALAFLTYPPILRINIVATPTLGSQAFPTGTQIPLDSLSVDNYNGWSPGNNWWVAPVAGVYFCYGQLSLSAFASQGNASAGLQVNGGTTTWGQAVFTPASGVGPNVGITRRLRLAAGDTVALIGQQNSGGNLTVKSPDTKLIIVWESA